MESKYAEEKGDSKNDDKADRYDSKCQSKELHRGLGQNCSSNSEDDADREWQDRAAEKKKPTADADIGFVINSMNMRNASNGELMWQSGTWGAEVLDSTSGDELEAHVPKAILSCRAISREINFTAAKELRNFRLEQRIFFNGQCMEEWLFDFGFVIPGSTNSWQQSIEAADQMMPAELLSGNIVIETKFFDGDDLVIKFDVRVFYD